MTLSLKPLPTFEEWEAESRATENGLEIYLDGDGVLNGWTTMNISDRVFLHPDNQIPIPKGYYRVKGSNGKYTCIATATASPVEYQILTAEFENIKNKIVRRKYNTFRRNVEPDSYRNQLADSQAK